MQSNQPYQRVNTQEDNNNTLYKNMAIDVGVNLAVAGAFDAAGIFSLKKAQTPEQRQQVIDNYYTDRRLTNATKFAASQISPGEKVGPLPVGKMTHGINDFVNRGGIVTKVAHHMPVMSSSSKWGRIAGYGGGLIGGMFSGAIRTNMTED